MRQRCYPICLALLLSGCYTGVKHVSGSAFEREFTKSQTAIGAEEANLLAASEWSKPISLQNDGLHDQAIRARLLIIQGREPAYGGPPTTNGAMTFVELQNVTGSCCDDIDIYFSVTNLHCELLNATGTALPEPDGGAWSGRGP